MNKTRALALLKAMGTAQNRKVYARHGVQGPAFGVSYANLGKLRRQIGVDHDLALELWASGNHDARVLATMIADPQRVTARVLDEWVRDLDSYVVTDAFSKLAAGTRHAHKRSEKWIAGRGEWTGAAGWNLVGMLSGADGVLTDAECEAHLRTIERRIHASPNRVRYAMNGALIAIGVRSAKLQKKALAAARRIGPVEVDHGETGCKTPDAAAAIRKTTAHRKAKAARSPRNATSSASRSRAKR